MAIPTFAEVQSREARDVLTTKKGVQIERKLWDSEAHAICSDTNLVPAGSFGADLAQKFPRGLTNDQRTWLHKIALEALEKQAKAAEPAPISLDMAGIKTLFQTAGGKLLHPRITLRLGYEALVIAPTGPGSKYPGAIHVSNGEHGVLGKYYGRITPEGEFKTTRDTNGDVIRLLDQLSRKPAETAAEHGRLTGRCCFCNTDLSDPRSLDQGYGPICAKNYSLPWRPSKAVGQPERVEA